MLKLGRGQLGANGFELGVGVSNDGRRGAIVRKGGGKTVPVEIDEDVRDEYWVEIRGLPERRSAARS